MNISTFLRNWALHYIEPTFLYLPRQRVKKGYITIRPVSYVHENHYYDSGYRQYFYVDYQKAIVTGTLRYEQGSKEDNRAQYPCLYRVYEYNEKRKKYIPINTKGEKDFDCTKSTLYRNEQQFKLELNKHYYYCELQSSDGDILHFNIEEFWLDKEGTLKTKTSNLNQINTFLEPIKNSDESQFILEIRHYPKLVKIYNEFTLFENDSKIEEHSQTLVSEKSWFSYDNPEPWANGLPGATAGGKDSVELESSKLYTIAPKIKKMTYMEKEINLPIIYKDNKRLGKRAVVQIGQGYTDISPSPSKINWYLMGGEMRWAKTVAVAPKDKMNKDIYISNGNEEILLHHGEEIEWSDTSISELPRNAAYEPEKYTTGHYFTEIKEEGYIKGDVNDNSERPSVRGIIAYAGSLQGASPADFDTMYGNFWKKKIPNQTWVSYRSTNYAEAITVGTQIRSYVDSFDSESGIHIELTTSSEGNLTQNIDGDYSIIENFLARVKITSNKFIGKLTEKVYDQQGKITYEQNTEKVLREERTGYAWAGAEDIAGMASWAIEAFTKLDPDGNSEKPYKAIGCGPGMPLRIAFAQYENENTENFTEDSFFITESYGPDEVLLPYDSPIKRKEKRAYNDISYAEYDEDKFKLYTEKCTAGCSTIVSFIKSTREGYKKYFQQTDEYDSDQWLKNKEDLNQNDETSIV